jgi:hypothetical protein
VSEQIDWERVRIDAAIAAMQAIISEGDCDDYSEQVAEFAVNFAFDLVHELRQTQGQMPLEVKPRRCTND